MLPTLNSARNCSALSLLLSVRCSNGSAVGVLSYRVELAVTDDTAEGAFICFDGVMARLHNLRASETSQMLAEEGVNPEDSKVPPFTIDMEGKLFTFKVRGGTDGDDAVLPDGSAVPVESGAGDDCSNASVSADANPANDATRKGTRASTKAVKKAHVV